MKSIICVIELPLLDANPLADDWVRFYAANPNQNVEDVTLRSVAMFRKYFHIIDSIRKNSSRSLSLPLPHVSRFLALARMMLKGNFKLGSCVAAVLSTVKAVAIIGKPEGFGSKASGGVAGPTVTPSNTVELTRYLVQEGPLNIVVEKTFDFRELQGIAWECGCAPYGIASMCQLAINKRGWCQTVQPAAPMVAMEYQKASLYPLVVSSDKSVLGVNKKGIIRGKGFLMADGTNNVILQNLEIKNLNARYKWVGDAITLDGTSNIWIDHIKV